MTHTMLKKITTEHDRIKKETRDLRRALNHKEAFLDALPTGFIVIQGERIKEVNAVMLHHLGYTAEETLSRDLREFMPGRQQKPLSEVFEKELSAKTASQPAEIELIGKDGTVHGWDMKIQKKRSPDNSSFLLMLTPNEERKAKEKLLARSTKELALHTMASAISNALYHSTRSFRQRTGLTQEGSGLGHEQQIKGIEDMVLDLEEIAHALECLARKNEDQSHAVPFDLRKVLREALNAAGQRLKDDTEHRAADIRVKTYLRSVSPVEGIPDEIQQVLSHVIMNALEAMPRGGALYISTEENAGFANIFIQDSGNGISAENSERVFDPFFTTKGMGKRGLGLSLSRAIIQRHGGELEISSKKDEGTTVTVRLPLAKLEGTSRKRTRQKKGIRNARILIIEAAPLIGDLLLQTLKSKGCRVDIAATAAEGLAQVRRKALDLVIVGADLSEVKGENLARRIKESMAPLPVALIKENDSVAGGDQQHPTLADLVISKPIDLGQVIDGITKILNTSR